MDASVLMKFHQDDSENHNPTSGQVEEGQPKGGLHVDGDRIIHFVNPTVLGTGYFPDIQIPDPLFYRTTICLPKQ